jgi:hypothetical protein
MDLPFRSSCAISQNGKGQRESAELTQRLAYHVDNSPLAVVEWGPTCG